MSQAPQIEITEESGVKVVTFQDASILDMTTIQQIGKQLYTLVEDGSTKSLVLDFGAVRFLSSQALGIMLTLRRKADKAGAHVHLASISPELHRVFSITNLDQLFKFFQTRTEAVNAFKA